jgi:enoyl-CoA hydratase
MFQALHYAVDEATAVITLNRPDRRNTIVPPMLDELEAAVARATADESVKVIILQGAGSSFCAGFDFAGGFHHWDAAIATDNQWDAGRDLVMVTHHQLG